MNWKEELNEILIDYDFDKGAPGTFEFMEAEKKVTKLIESLLKKQRADKLVKGCVVMMKASSGMKGYGDSQCVKSVCEPLSEISLYGHNEYYKIWDVKNILEYPILNAADGTVFVPLFDYCDGRDWQNIRFMPRPVKAIKLRGISQTLSPVFAVGELEAYTTAALPRKEK